MVFASSPETQECRHCWCVLKCLRSDITHITLQSTFRNFTHCCGKVQVVMQLTLTGRQMRLWVQRCNTVLACWRSAVTSTSTIWENYLAEPKQHSGGQYQEVSAKQYQAQDLHLGMSTKLQVAGAVRRPADLICSAASPEWLRWSFRSWMVAASVAWRSIKSPISWNSSAPSSTLSK